MKKYIFLTAIILLLFSACNHKKEEAIEIPNNTLEYQDLSETEKLVYYLEKYGNYINSKQVPALISQEEAFKNINNPSYYYIDIREKSDFISGHISRAYHVDFEDLPGYLEDEIIASHYDKIILICKAGQSASYATGLLRLLGYHNIYSLKWGMAAWNKKFSEPWLSNISSSYKSEFDTVKVKKHTISDLPAINTGKIQPQEILYEQILKLFSKGLKDFKVTPKRMLENKENYYIIDYIDAYKYDISHLSGSVQYQPEKSLQANTELRTLPKDQAIIIHCISGHKSAFVTAYLRILGYEASSLVFGRNGLIHETVKNKGWTAFSEELIHDYDFITGEKTIEPEGEDVIAPANDIEPESSIPLPINSNTNKDMVQGGCG